MFGVSISELFFNGENILKIHEDCMGNDISLSSTSQITILLRDAEII